MTVTKSCDDYFKTCQSSTPFCNVREYSNEITAMEAVAAKGMTSSPMHTVSSESHSTNGNGNCNSSAIRKKPIGDGPKRARYLLPITLDTNCSRGYVQQYAMVANTLRVTSNDDSSTTSKKPRTSMGATPKSVAEVGSATKTKTSTKKAAPAAVTATAKKRKIADLENDVSG